MPGLHLLQALANLFEAIARLGQQVLHTLAHTVRLATRTQQGDLAGEAADVGGEREELVGEVGGVLLELRVVGVLGVVGAAPGRGLRFQRVRVLEGHIERVWWRSEEEWMGKWVEAFVRGNGVAWWRMR